MRILGLVDCNSFYASCEKVFRPDLAGRPVVVLSNNDGCVVARSPEAKALGIEAGTPYFKIKHLCAREGVEAFSSNYALYGDMSARVMESLGHWTPRIEVYSIDEAFLDLTGIADACSSAYGQNLIRTVRQWTGIPVSLGIGTTKTLAKVANRLAKKRGGVLALTDRSAQDEELGLIAIEDVWGVAGRLGARLRRMGITTAKQLRDADPHQLRKTFSIVLERLARELAGETCLGLDDAPPPKQSICVSRSFGELVSDLQGLEQAVATFAARAGEKLRRQDSRTGGMLVQIQTDRFRPEDPQYGNSIHVGFPCPTSDTSTLLRGALDGLRQIYREGHLYKKAGVILLEITGQAVGDAQGDLFGCAVGRERGDGLMRVVDRLNHQMGRGTVVFGSQGIEQSWKLRAELRSPRYTTRWEELPKVG